MAWRGLIGAAIVATIGPGLILLADGFLKRSVRPSQVKRFYHCYFVWLLLALVVAFLLPGLLAPDLIERCLSEVGATPALGRALAGLWVIVVAILLTVDSIRVVLGIRAGVSLRPALDVAALGALEELRTLIVPRRAVGLALLADEGGPYVQGILRPRIALPASLLATDRRDELRGILAHELVHVRDHDVAWALVAQVLRRLFVFHPLVSRALGRYAVWVEKAADEQAVSGGRVPAPSLLKALLAAAVPGRAPRRPLQLAASTGFVELRERIESLAAPTLERRGRWSLRAFGVASVFSALIASLAQAEVAAASLRRPSTLPASFLVPEEILASVLVADAPLDRCKQP
jgi:beta-lactamase regulating signal transducer with metallopeptidase domain